MIFRFDGFEIDSARYELRHDGAAVSLEPKVLDLLLRNNFRAVCCAFASCVPLVIWSLAALPERAAVFRIVVGCAFVAGFARLTVGSSRAIPASWRRGS